MPETETPAQPMASAPAPHPTAIGDRGTVTSVNTSEKKGTRKTPVAEGAIQLMVISAYTAMRMRAIGTARYRFWPRSPSPWHASAAWT